MKYVDEFRDPRRARDLLDRIRRRVSRPWVMMEVCGGQTHSLLRHGIDAELDGTVELIHGPGCPVCVTPAESIDFAQSLAMRPKTTLVSFGDMLRVPGGRQSLLDVRAQGGSVRIAYSPLDAVAMAQREPDRDFVFFAVGFETTTPATALALLQADRLGLKNFSLLVAHVRVQPAMEAIMQSKECRVQGFLAAGHVCAVLGINSYAEFTRRYRVPVVVTGFEPVDLLEGILDCVDQLETGGCQVVNRYARTVRDHGNSTACQIVDQVFGIADRPWRGLGVISSGGLRLRSQWSHFDAEHRFAEAPLLPTLDVSECRSGDVLAGRIRPTACASFGTRCTPDTPLGAPMVSSEGACAAYFQFRRTMLAATLEACPSGTPST